MSDNYVPIDFSGLKNEIPSEQEIIYSTLCEGFAVIPVGITKMRKFKWTSHLLCTKDSFAIFLPDIFANKPKKIEPICFSWDVITEIPSSPNESWFKIGAIKLTLTRHKDYETKEAFRDRAKEFIPKFKEIIIKKKEIWYEVNQNNPDINKHYMRLSKNFLARWKGKV